MRPYVVCKSQILAGCQQTATPARHPSDSVPLYPPNLKSGRDAASAAASSRVSPWLGGHKAYLHGAAAYRFLLKMWSQAGCRLSSSAGQSLKQDTGDHALCRAAADVSSLHNRAWTIVKRQRLCRGCAQDLGAPLAGLGLRGGQGGGAVVEQPRPRPLEQHLRAAEVPRRHRPCRRRLHRRQREPAALQQPPAPRGSARHRSGKWLRSACCTCLDAGPRGGLSPRGSRRDGDRL